MKKFKIIVYAESLEKLKSAILDNEFTRKARIMDIEEIKQLTKEK